MTNVYVPDEQETEYKGFHYWTFEGTYYFRDIGTLPANMNSEESVRAVIDVVSENKQLQSAIADKDTEILRLRSLLKEVKEGFENDIFGVLPNGNEAFGYDEGLVMGGEFLTALMEKLKQENL